MIKCTKAIIPVAGYGTRRLPVTKAIEKCMLPIGNRPLVDYVVEDILKAGISDIIFVVSEQSEQLQSYYGSNETLEHYLAERGKTKELEQIQAISKKANFHYVEQSSNAAYGTAVPVALCADFIQPDEQVIVMGGDDFVWHPDETSETARLLDIAKASGATAAMLMAQVPKEQVSRYGVLKLREKDGVQFFEGVVEKPSPDKAPSSFINISKYLFDKKMFDYAQQVLDMAPSKNGEYEITTALNLYIADSNPIVVLEAAGTYLDGGSLEGWLYANQFIHDRPRIEAPAKS